jgi:hypothetical protein
MSSLAQYESQSMQASVFTFSMVAFVFGLILEGAMIANELLGGGLSLSFGSKANTLLYVAGVVSSIAYVVFLRKSNRNARLLKVSELSFGPAAIVLWHLVPIAFFFMPYKAIRELYIVSDPNFESDGSSLPHTGKVPVWFKAWWGAFVATVIAFAATVLVPTAVATVLALFGIALLALHCVLSILLVQQIAKRQDLRYYKDDPLTV